MQYKEHEKLKAVHSDCQAIGGFIEWLQSSGRVIASYSVSDDSDTLYDSGDSIQGLLAEHFGIDQNTLEREKMHMLAECRAMYEPKDCPSCGGTGQGHSVYEVLFNRGLCGQCNGERKVKR